MRTIIWFSVLVFCFVLLAPAYPAQAEDTAQLQAKIADLEKRVSDLEKLLQPMKAKLEQQARQTALREKFIKRLQMDRQNHSQEQMREAEKLYQVGNSKWGTPEAIESLQKMIEKYPNLNRTGCAVLYLAQSTSGQAREQYLKECISKFNDCYYGDGVQVGAYARFLLMDYYRTMKEDDKANKLSEEIKQDYPDAINHSGRLLVELIK